MSYNIIITGSTSGIGRAIAEEFAKAGHNIMLNGLGDAQEIEEMRSSFEEEYNIAAYYHPADMRDHEQIGNMVEMATEKLGSIDILVNNAGVQHVSLIENFCTEKWRQIIDINLSACFYTTKYIIGMMKERGFGRIINIASAHGIVASPFKAAYVASKHGLVGLTKVIAQEVANFDNITCNAICPGWVETPLARKQVMERMEKSGRSYSEEAAEMVGEKQPRKRFTNPADIGQMALFLCSDAAQNITGSVLPIDGGWTSQ